MLNLNKLSKITFENATKRMKNGAHIKSDSRSMLKHCATEVVEAVEAFNDWQTDLRFGAVSMGVTDPDFVVDYKQHFEDELADIICCCFFICD